MSFALNLDKLFKAVDYNVSDRVRESVGFNISSNIFDQTEKVWWSVRYGVNDPVRKALPITTISTKTSNYEFIK